MTSDEKLNLLLEKQKVQFEYFERRLNMIEARLIAFQSIAADTLAREGVTPFSALDLHGQFEDLRQKTGAALSEFPSRISELPDGIFD